MESPQKIKYNFGGIENYSFYNNSIKYFKKKNSKLKFLFFQPLKIRNILKTKSKKTLKLLMKIMTKTMI